MLLDQMLLDESVLDEMLLSRFKGEGLNQAWPSLNGESLDTLYT